MSQSQEAERDQAIGSQIPFEALNEPGAYVCNWNGHLLRIPEDALKPGRSPTLEIKANEQLLVTKISSDPYIQLTKARMRAADADVQVSF